MLNDIETMLQLAAREVFSTMLNIDINFGALDTNMGSTPFVAGTIGFTGKFNAVIYLYTNLRFARRMTSLLLGLPESAIDGHELINDAIGELTNMHAGHLKSRFSDKGLSCSITIPTVVHGNDFSIVPVSGASKKAICVCAKEQETVLLELIIKP